MGEFFRGWRRKAGVVTLAMTCVFMAWWVRSGESEDRLATMITPKCIGMIFSADSCIAISLMWSMDNESDIEWRKNVMLIHFYHNMKFTIMDSYQNGLGSWPTGFGFFQKEICDDEFAGFLAPYWSIVIPLTLLSACLLLGKPRMPAPKKADTPTPLEGA